MKTLLQWFLNGCMALMLALNVSAALTHRYSFGADAQDSVGGATGQLVNGASISGGALLLNGSSQYLNLPNGILSNHHSLTIEVWITDNNSGGWARIFDFGSSTAGEDFAIGTSGTASTKGIFLTPRSGGGSLRGSHTVTGGGGGEQVVEWSGVPLPAGVRKHVLWVYDATSQTARLYVDGQQVGINELVTIKPSDCEPTVNNWLGRAQFSADPFLNASIYEFRMYDTALSPMQIALNGAAGPEVLVNDPGTLQTIQLSGPASLVMGASASLNLRADYQQVTNVNITAVSGVAYFSSNTNVATVSPGGVISAIDGGVVVITATYLGQTAQTMVNIIPPPQTLRHRYSFTADAADAVGGANGTLMNGAAIVSGQVTLDGVSHYVDLPNNMFTNFTNITFEAWATDTGSAGWARVWDFGNSSGGEGNQGGGTSYMFMAWPYGGGGGIRGAYKTASGGEQLISATPQPSLNAPHHIVWTQDAASQTARLYVDGVLAGSNTGFTYTPAAIGTTFNDWLGRSQFNDPWFKGSIDEFRIYDVALTAAEVAQNYQLGPDVSAQSGPVNVAGQPQNLAVPEGQDAVFRVNFTGVRPVALQWYRDGQPIAGATNSSYVLRSVTPGDDAAVFGVALTNQVAGTTYSIVSSNAVLDVILDVIPPAITRAFNIGTNQVRLVFNEALNGHATNLANFAFADGITPVSSASLSSAGTEITLATGPLEIGQTYSLILNGLQDLAATPNVIATNTLVVFVASPYAPVDVGSAAPATYAIIASNRFDVSAGGAGFGGATDQFGFHYQLLSGDFDVRVRVANLIGTDLWAQAGLMARVSLEADSPFAAAVTTPGALGSYFMTRVMPGSKAAITGSFPPNPPSVWLRLQRAGDTFNGYASFDGLEWTQLGAASLPGNQAVYLGMCLASRADGAVVTASFADLGNNTSTVTVPLAAPGEPLGPSTRRTGLVFSEIMYRPATRADGRVLEFIEIYNSNPFFHDIGGYRISGDIDYQFPKGTIIPANSFLVVAVNPGDVMAEYGLSGVMGPYTNTLRTSSTLRLRDEQDAILLELTYDNQHPWPMAADGTGHSIVLARPSYGENDPRAWAISDHVGGSPGRFESYSPSPLRAVVINEVLANAGVAQDYVELYNHSPRTVNVSGCILTDTPGADKFRVPDGTEIGPGGFIVFQQAQLGFGLKGGGDTIYFKNPDGSRVLDAVRFEDQAEGVSLGRFPNGAADFYLMAAQTPGASNGVPRISEVVINELMYHPISKQDDDQYLELYNPHTMAVDLSGWRFVDGIDYTIPSQTILPPDGYLVVAKNRTNLLAKYPDLNPANVVGDFGGRLAHSGERVALARPFTNIVADALGRLETNYIQVMVEEVTYGDGGRWGEWADGGGSSLELMDPQANRRLAPNWADSDESAKAPWTTIEIVNGLLDHGSNYNNEAIAYFQVGQLDPGECLVDNFEVLRQGNTQNYATNPGFESGLSGWGLYGCFSRSSLATGAGVGGGNALHLRTGNRFFTLANHAEGAMTSGGLAVGNYATLRFQARWLRGCPDILMRLRGNWLEAAGRMTVPANLGTPGARNSRALTNSGPAIVSVRHDPPLPTAGQSVVVTARIEDLNGLNGTTLNYRLDTETNSTAVSMRDDGSEGDAVAGDGIYSAAIPGQAERTTVAFVVSAADVFSAGSRFPALQDNNAPVRECVVRWGEPQPVSSFGTYHQWLTAANVARWKSLPVLSNEDIDATLVYNGRIIYNMFAHYAGSPYHQAYDGPDGVLACHYSWEMPKDDKLLGHASFNKMHWIGNDIQDDNANANNNDSTLQREQVANELLRGLGLPWVYRRYVAVYVNGVRRGQLMEDALRPSVSVPDAYFPNDTGGYLYKVQPWFEGGAPNAGNNAGTPWQNKDWSSILPYTTAGGAYKQARYRWIYQVRETADSQNNYTNLFNLISSANAYNSPLYFSNMMAVANMENWMRLIAANHAAGNWDCFGVQNSQNVYGYASPNVPWTLFMFDFSIVLGNRISWGPGANLEFVVPGNANFPPDVAFQRIYSNPTSNPNNPGNPVFRRMFWRGLKELANRVMLPQNIERLMDARYAAFRASGVAAASPQPIKDWIASARSSIASQAAAFDTTQFGPATSIISLTTNAYTLTGKAPLEVVTLLVNGRSWPVTWTSMTDWSLRLAVASGTNIIQVTGLDYFGQPVVGATRELTVICSQVTDDPAGQVGFNEIMANPAIPDAEYVELHNASTTTTFDLSGWRINGLSYTFPGGSLIGPRGYLLLAKDRAAVSFAYGASTPVYDVFDGNLQSDGETLSLLRPDSSTTNEIIIDQVRYEAAEPWPAATNGAALQLVDARQDNSRVSNWQLPSADWRYVTYTGTNVVASAQLLFMLNGLGDVYIDSVSLVEGFVPEVGANLVVNGEFDLALTNGWTLPRSNLVAEISTNYARTGAASLHLRTTNSISVINNTSLKQAFTPQLATARAYTLSYWYLPAPGNPNFTARLYPGVFTLVHSAAPPVPATPGLANSLAATLPPYPEIWLNEVQPLNATGEADGAGERDPWLEMFNAGTNTLSLAGWNLSDSYANLPSWSFPSDAVIQPGEFLVVWMDGQPGQTANREYHTAFRLAPTNGSVVLSRLLNDTPQIVDYLNFSSVPADYSYGAAPDGQPFHRQIMARATPGQTNDARPAPVVVYINEWMAANQQSVADSANGGAFSDWFELYNPGAEPADLSGYSLTDNLGNPNQFRIPQGWHVPAGGFLLVWADNKSSLNSNRTDLHVNFALRQDGEAIGLFDPDGRLVDAVVFSRQTNDVSEGRWPDGATARSFFTSPTPGQFNRLDGHVTPPALLDPSVNAGGDSFSFMVETVTGRVYWLESKANLSPGTPWQAEATNQGTGNPLTFTLGLTNGPQRYYRLGTSP